MFVFVVVPSGFVLIVVAASSGHCVAHLLSFQWCFMHVFSKMRICFFVSGSNGFVVGLTVLTC